jgi:uncharacterized protein
MSIKKRSKFEEDLYLSRIREIIFQFFDSDTGIVLFGSRASGNESPHSDYDIAIISRSKDKMRKISLVKEELENSTIPFKVDVLDYYSTTGLLREEIARGIKWNA